MRVLGDRLALPSDVFDPYGGIASPTHVLLSCDKVMLKGKRAKVRGMCAGVFANSCVPI